MTASKTTAIWLLTALLAVPGISASDEVPGTFPNEVPGTFPGGVPGTSLGTSPASAGEVVATFRGGEIYASEYSGWLAFHRLEDDAAFRVERLGRLAMLKTLAAETSAVPPDRTLALELAEPEQKALAASLRRSVAAGVTISPAAVERELEERDDERRQPRKVQLRNIFRQVPTEATPEERAAIRAEVEALHRRLVEGADFGALATAHSESQTRHRGGRMGIAKPGKLPDDLEKVVFALEPGEVTGVLETKQGFHVFKCDRVVEARVMPKDEARQRLERYLRREAVKERQQALDAELLAEANLRIDLAALRGSDADAVVLRFTDRALTRNEAAWVLRKGSRMRSPITLSENASRARLEAYALQTLAAERARALHLDEDPELQEKIRWQRFEILAAAAMRGRVAAVTTPPSDEAVRAHFDAHRERYRIRERYRLAVIRLPLNPTDQRATSRLAAELTATLRSGEVAFEEVARQHSRHRSSAAGGDLGWKSRREIAAMGPELFRAVMGLEAGATSDPVREGDGLFILRVLEKDPPRPARFDEVEAQAKRDLAAKQARTIQKKTEAALLSDLGLTILADG